MQTVPLQYHQITPGDTVMEILLILIPHHRITVVIHTWRLQEASHLPIHHHPGLQIIQLRHIPVEVVIQPRPGRAEVTQVVIQAETQVVVVAAADTEDNRF